MLTDRSGDLLEEMMQLKSKEIADELDANIIRELLIESGWHQVVLSPMTWEAGYTVDQWVSSNIKGRIWTYGLVWMFEEDKDAMWFKLKWLS